jgi:hypothetical protein
MVAKGSGSVWWGQVLRLLGDSKVLTSEAGTSSKPLRSPALIGKVLILVSWWRINVCGSGSEVEVKEEEEEEEEARGGGSG